MMKRIHLGGRGRPFTRNETFGPATMTGEPLPGHGRRGRGGDGQGGESPAGPGRGGRHGAGRPGGGRHGGGPDGDSHGHGPHGHPRRGRRLFDYGELRLLVLALIAETPAHGYELIKAIEERMGGAYSPSPGVMYPTLSWLVDMGYAGVEAEGGGRKRYAITTEGAAFLAANRAGVDSLLARNATGGDGGEPGPTGPGGRGRHGAPAPVLRAMENLKTALRLRIGGEALDEAAIGRIAAAIDAAAHGVEQA